MIKKLREIRNVEEFSGTDVSYEQQRHNLGIPGKLMGLFIEDGFHKEPDLWNLKTGELGFDMEIVEGVYCCLPQDEFPHIDQFEVYELIKKHLGKKHDLPRVFYEILAAEEFVEPFVLCKSDEGIKIGFIKKDVYEFFEDKSKRDKFLEKF